MLDHLRKFAAAYCVAVGGLFMTCLSSWNVRQELQTSHHKEFEWAAGDRLQSVAATVDQGLDALLEVKALFLAAPTVNASAFAAIAASILERRPYIDRLYWVPEQQAALIARPARHPTHGTGAVALAEAATIGTPQPAAVFGARQGAPGRSVDDALQVTDEIVATLQQARTRGQLAVSQGVTQERPGHERLLVVYAALPVIGRPPGDPNAAAKLLGFLVGMYNVNDLVHVAINVLEPRGVDVVVRDESESADGQVLVYYASRLQREPAVVANEAEGGNDDQPRLGTTIRVGDRRWSITGIATQTFRSAEAFTKAHWSVLVGGVLFTALISFYLVHGRRQLDKRIRLTQTLYEREELFRQLAETVDVVFFATSADTTRLEYLGPAFRQIAGPGVRYDTTSPSLLFDLFSVEDRTALEDALADLRQEGRRFSITLPVSCSERGRRWLRVSGFPVYETANELTRIVGFLEDITEHKLAADALRDSEAKLRTLFNHSPDLIFTVDPEANILFTNRPLPYAVGGGRDRRSERMLPPAVRERYLDTLRQVFASGHVGHCQYSSNDATWWEIRMVPISTGGEVMAAMVVVTDITENRKLQWQALRSARLASLGVLSAGIAHEISNPNHAIQANASVLARIWHDALPIFDEYAQEQGEFLLAGLGFAEARETIARGMRDISDNARRIQRIVTNLKHLGKQDHGHMDEVADIGEILQSVVRLLDARIRKQTDSLTLTVPPGLPSVKGNVQQLEQVFIN
ncbi:MAG: PAS domain S-box protein, partial [Rhodocyclaceae bacterium]